MAAWSRGAARARLLVHRVRGRRGSGPGVRALRSGLKFSLVPAETTPYVGRGQVTEFSGWLFHTRAPVRRAWLLADGREHSVRLGYRRPDVVKRQAKRGHRVPMGAGAGVAIPLAAVDNERLVTLRLRVELAGGKRVERDLPDLRVLPGTGAAPLTVVWPSTGPKVAICLASWSPREDYLRQQLDSIRAQDHQNWVCIVCDDASPAASVTLIRAAIAGDPRFVLAENDANVGFYRNFERALRLVPADAELVALSDQDDIWYKDKLSTLVMHFDDPEVQLAYSDMRLVDQDGVPFADSFWNKRRNQWDDLIALLQLNTVTGAACMIRADLVSERVLPFPPGLAFHDHWVALVALASGRMSFADRPLYSYRQHTGAVTGHREDDFGAGLPSAARLALAALSPRHPLPAQQRVRLESLARFELPRISCFATVLLMRDSGGLPSGLRRRLSDLSGADQRILPWWRLTRLPASTRAAATHADRQFLAGAVWHRAQRRRRLVLPPGRDASAARSAE